MPTCDGCGAQANDGHVRSRIERLEKATRFRPIHIKFLLLAAAPPEQLEDFFYDVGNEQANRSADARHFFSEMAILAGISERGPEELDAERVRDEFQRAGFFLTTVLECPVSPGDLSASVKRFAPVLIRRVQLSYQPKWIVPIGENLESLIPLFEFAGMGDRLLLRGAEKRGTPFGGKNFGAEILSAISSRR